MYLKHPFRIIFYAPSFSGKTTQITNLLENKQFKKQFKNNIFLFSPTSFSDKSYKGLLKDKNIFEDYDEEIIKEIMEESKSLIKEDKGKKKTPILLILDDAITDIQRNNGILNVLFTKGRHYNISLIISTQQAHLCTPAMRLNCSHKVLFPQKLNDMELKALSELMPVDKKIFYEIIEDLRKDEPYSFLLVDFTAPNMSKMFLKNGKQFYKIKDE